MATLIIPTPLRKYAKDTAQFQTDSLTIEQAFEDLVDAFPDLKNHLLDGNDQVRSFIKVFVGEDDIKALDGLETELQDSDIVSIVPAIAGGSW
jgi:molybdopterin converting factor small subunit